MDREKVNNYLLNEKGVESEMVRERLANKVLKYDDIAADFMTWLEQRSYENCKAEVNHWTAQRIYDEAKFLDGIGAFNFLVDLRDNPVEAEEIIAEGFVIK